jgi:SlyX protein
MDTMTRAPQSVGQDVDSRVDALEMRVTYQDQVIEQLNTVIVDQWSQLTQALGRIDRLENRLRETLENAGHDSHDEPPPPHY